MKNKVILRHQAIRELVKSHAFDDQQTLVRLITEKYGIKTNQSIVSRDLRHLGISKQKVGNTFVYELKDSDASKAILHLCVHSVDHNESLIVVHTIPGLASFVADYLDMYEDAEILATLAGENVVFVAPRSIKKIHETFKKVCDAVYIKKDTK